MKTEPRNEPLANLDDYVDLATAVYDLSLVLRPPDEAKALTDAWRWLREDLFFFSSTAFKTAGRLRLTLRLNAAAYHGAATSAFLRAIGGRREIALAAKLDEYVADVALRAEANVR
jgi:hypothetical protein